MDNLDGRGLLWFDDNSSRTTLEKIRMGIARYSRKWGILPGAVRVHRASLDPNGDIKEVDGILVEDGIGPPFHLFVTGGDGEFRGAQEGG